jgi:hypothetical protein
VIVSPPGGALKAYEVDVASGAELLFQVDPLGGELVVDLGKSGSYDDKVFAIWQNDVGIPTGMLVSWAEGNGGRFFQGKQVRIPQLAPGSYTVCLGTSAVVASHELDAWKGRARCATGYLAAGSSLDLRLQ